MNNKITINVLGAGVLFFLSVLIFPPLIICALVRIAISRKSRVFFKGLVGYVVSSIMTAREKNYIFVDKIINDQKIKNKLLILVPCITIILVLIFLHLRQQQTGDFIWFVIVQISLTLLLTISILGLAWTIFSMERFFDSLFIKTTISVLISACFIVSNLLAIEFFSTYFPFPPSLIPVAYTIGVMMLAFAFTSIIFSIIAIVFEIIMLTAVSKNIEKNPAFLFLAALVFIVGFLGSYTASIAAFQGITPKGQLFMIKLAQKYDFTSHHMCDTKSEEVVLFVGNVLDRAYAATFPDPKYLPSRNVSDEDFKGNLPKNFRMVRCNPLP